MRLSQLFWYGRTYAVPIDDQAARKAFSRSGDLTKNNFTVWWNTTGKYVFSEPIRPRDVRELNLEAPTRRDLYEKSVVVEIPLTVSKQKIFKQLREILNKHYVNEEDPSRRVNVASFSLADLKLHTKRFHTDTLEKEYFTLLYRIMYPNIQQWVIADRLQLVEDINIRLTAQDWRQPEVTAQKKYLQAVVGRYLYKARFSRFHLERGTFPKYDKVDVDAVMPFGEARNAHFMLVTDEQKKKSKTPRPPSEWQVWVRKQYWRTLKAHIIERKNLHDRHNTGSRDFDDLFEKYLRGEINL